MTRIDIERRPAAHSHWWVWLVVALLVLLMAAAAWYFLSERNQSAAAPNGPAVGDRAAGPMSDRMDEDAYNDMEHDYERSGRESSD